MTQKNTFNQKLDPVSSSFQSPLISLALTKEAFGVKEMPLGPQHPVHSMFYLQELGHHSMSCFSLWKK